MNQSRIRLHTIMAGTEFAQLATLSMDVWSRSLLIGLLGPQCRTPELASVAASAW